MGDFDLNGNFSNHGRYDPWQGSYPVFRTNPDDRFINNIIDNFLPRYEEWPRHSAWAIPPTSIVSYTGTTQYRFGDNRGIASCGLCASNFARQVFEKYTSGMRNRDLLRWLLTRDCHVKITEISRHYRGNIHLQASNIVGAPSFDRFLDGAFFFAEDAVPGVPYFSEVLDPQPPLDGLLCTYEAYREILRTMDNIRGISAAMITSPPEIVGAIKIPMEGAHNGRIFVLFDSHGNHEFYPSGSGMIICPTLEAAATILIQKYQEKTNELPTPEICASFVVPKAPPTSTSAREEISIAASIRILDLQNKVSELNAAVREKNEDLKKERETMKEHEDTRVELLSGLVDRDEKIVDLNQRLESALRELLQEKRKAEEIRIAASHDAFIMQNTLEEKDRYVLELQEEVRLLHDLHGSRRKACSAAEKEVVGLRNSLRKSGESIANLQRQLQVLRHKLQVSGVRENWAAHMTNQAYEKNNYRAPPVNHQYTGVGPECTRHHTRPTAAANYFFQRNVHEPGWEVQVQAVHDLAISSPRHHLGDNHASRHH